MTERCYRLRIPTSPPVFVWMQDDIWTLTSLPALATTWRTLFTAQAMRDRAPPQIKAEVVIEEIEA